MGILSLIVIIALSIVLYFVTTINGMFMFLAVFSTLMFFNVTLSTMTNALRGLSVKANDTFWRLFLSLMASAFLALAIFL